MAVNWVPYQRDLVLDIAACEAARLGSENAVRTVGSPLEWSQRKSPQAFGLAPSTIKRMENDRDQHVAQRKM